jgi:lysophospholipase L1-like esterase
MVACRTGDFAVHRLHGILFQARRPRGNILLEILFLARRPHGILLLGILFLSAAGCSPGEEGAEPATVLRVACVGDSITYGNGIEDRERWSYPAQLGRRLGAGYEVRNFGVNGATLLKKGNLPYREQPVFREALDFEPHLVIINLGINDTQPGNWKHKKEFAVDYKALIACFADLASRPKVYACLPLPAFGDKVAYQDRVLREQMIPMIRAMAREAGVPVIDLYSALEGRPGCLIDSFHPNREGARIMAETIYSALMD